MIRMTEQQARELLGDKYPGKKKKRHKHNAQKTVLDGITFPSKHEANYYAALKLRVRAGEVSRFELQPAFVLQEAFIRNGKKVREIKYIADFKIFYPDGSMEIVDTKGFRTKDYKLKKKLFLAKYPDVKFTEA